VRAAVDAKVSQASAAGQLPVLVAYAIPHRDCGGASGGGVAEDAYRAWIRSFAAGIGNRPAAVIVEPDALAQLDCLGATAQQARLELLRDAVAVLDVLPATVAYLDAGHSAWQPAGVIAERLRAAGVASAQGFSLNVSNFMPTSGEVTYGQTVSSLLSGAHFVVDTSRNGQGSNGEWCNPVGRGLGTAPTAATGNAFVDAFLWVKAPGESDGTCNGGPPAGQWWTEYALGLASRAA
jgi:endoglucanase